MSDIREEPWRRDPIARYDHLGRKLPKKLGALEVSRAVPGFAALFDREVPPDRFVVQEGQAIVECQCGEDAYCNWNQADPCPGGCGRWFWHLAGKVRVARLTVPPHVET